MPYIKEENRILSKEYGPKSPGDLNFLITNLITEYMSSKDLLSYQTINDIIGALEGAKLEFYRRIAVPYENAKLSENGDVYTNEEKKVT